MTKVTSLSRQLIKKQMCNKEFFSPEYNDYPILIIWENGVQIEKAEGSNVLKKIATEMALSE